MAFAVGCAGPAEPTITPPSPRPSFAVLPPLGAGDYTILYIPDTQYYSETYPATWTAQVDWIARVKDSLNIVFVSHLGDVVDNVGQAIEWQRASAAMAVLDTLIPLGIAPGNHDIQGNWAKTNGSWSTYRSYFPASRYSSKPYWGGYYQSSWSARASSFQRITVGSTNLLFLHLEFQAPDDVLAWARGVVDAHPTYRVHVSTHSYLTASGQRLAYTKNLRLNGNQGEQMWQELVRRSPNVRLVHSAHLCGEARAVSVNDAGRSVDEILTDYQCGPNGGDGWLRFYVVRPALGVIEAYTYSPTRDEWDTDSASQFTLPYTP